MGKAGQMDLFEALPWRSDAREGWIQIDLFFAAEEDARERRLNGRARPRQAPIYRQAPLVAVATPKIRCGVKWCRATFYTDAARLEHGRRDHARPVRIRAGEGRPMPQIAEDEDAIRARIRAAMGRPADAREGAREGEVA